jgi:translation initiation factor 2 beta subunit (eIF-2beta)/eIF-5
MESADYTIEKLNEIKTIIEKMEKYHQIEILKIMVNSKNTKINENKSGVFINLSFIEKSVLDKIQKYINYEKEQNKLLNQVETEKEQYKSSFFTGAATAGGLDDIMRAR